MAGCGYWRERYTYQVPTTTVDGAGQGSTVYANSVVGLAGVVTPSQREVMDDMGVSIRTDVVIETAWDPNVSAVGRLVDVSSGTIYNIMSVVDPDGGKRRRLRITAANMDGEVQVEAPEVTP